MSNLAKKSSQYPKAFTLALTVLCLLNACALTDLTPPEGYPDYQSNDLGYVNLLNESAFEFHQNPILE